MKRRWMRVPVTALSFAAGAMLAASGTAQAAVITFDDLVTGATSYAWDGDGDGIPDVVFSTTDPTGFNTVGPGTNMTYIQQPGLEGTSLLAPDLRVDFTFGARDSIRFGFALDSNSQDDTASLSLFDSTGNLLGITTAVGLYTTTPSGTSNYPEGIVDLPFAGTAAYGTFDFTSDYGRFIIDNFAGTYGSTEVVPEPGTLLLLGSGLIGVAGYGRRKRSA